jgi:hypothetical protein
MPIPEDNTIIEPEQIPEEIRQRVSDKIIAQIDTSVPIRQKVETSQQVYNHADSTNTSSESSDNQLLGLATDEQRVLTFIQLHNPTDKYFLNWSNIFTLGELYYSNYTSEVYREYQNKLKLLTAKYYNPKRFILHFNNTQIRAYAKDTGGKGEPHKIPDSKPLDVLDKPIFIDAQTEMKSGYAKIRQMHVQVENTYKFLTGLPYVEPVDKKKFVKLRNNFIRAINAYYTHMYYFNRINGYNMKDKPITLPHLNMTYSEEYNQMLPRIDKITIRLSDDIIMQKYDNDTAKLKLFLEIKKKIQEQHIHPKDKKKNDELQALLKDYLEFDKVYQSKLNSHITTLKTKKIISDLIILEGQPQPGDGAVVNPNEGMDDTVPTTTNLKTLSSSNGFSKDNTALDDMDESDSKRKFYFINKAKRERAGDF